MSLIIKICGLSTPGTLDTALEAGADMVGFVFFPPSPRHLQFDVARALSRRVGGRAQKVALTVDADEDYIAAVIEALQPDMLQLHGKESPKRLTALKTRFGLPIIKALAVEVRSDFDLVKNYASAGDWILFDAKAPANATRPGGLGKPFDWTLLSGAIPGVPVMLSGGLDAKNIEEALRITRAPAVDVSSGVESSPGEKDPNKIREFVKAARQAHVQLPPYEVVREP
jgi:phosphoribosylanthranilate isomerase